MGGAMPAILNAANEVAVAAFLAEQISFLAISEIVSEVVRSLSAHKADTTLSDILAADAAARALARELCNF